MSIAWEGSKTLLMLYAQIQGLELMAQAESDKESCFMMGYHDSRSAVAKRFV